MSTTVGSSTQYAGTIQVQRISQDLQKAQIEKLLPPPVQQSSGVDSARFSSEALARLQSEQQAQAAKPPAGTTA